jgi:hypothetical protein
VNIDLDKLARQFAEHVIAQNSAIRRGDARMGNRHAKGQLKCAHQLMRVGEEGTKELASLFNHQDPGVREMAAVFLLKRRTGEALALLSELSKLPGLVGFGAEQAIERWNEGTWDLEPKDE